MYLEYSKLNEIKINESTVILTRKNGLGWKWDEGNRIIFDYRKHTLELEEENSVLALYLMKNDIIQIGYIVPTDICQYEIFITECGTYQLCLCIQEE